ncbi:MAG: ATP-binding cassette domain-containing protein [Elusimicrobia bacterium]|nr:ATP-binding cassette domain-containing protein [Elusimicrobiota bacterium]
MTHAEPLIRFKHASLGYGRHPVLHGVDLEVTAGSFVGILGHNGSGKTTTLRTILGLIPCLRGEFTLRGRGLGAPRFGYVPQKERLDPLYPLSAYDVAAMGTYRKLELLRRLRRRDHHRLVEHALSVCGASALAPRRFSDLSGGQKQRVLIARALAAEPEVLALDEPMAGIDITTQKALIKLLKKLKEENELTILMVSHRVQVEKDLFSHVVWCDEGQVQSGTTAAMLAGTKLEEIFKSEL